MALIIPVGFAQVLLPMQHGAQPRSASITFGIDTSALGGDYAGAANAIVARWMDTFGAEQDSEVSVGPAVLRVGQDGGDPLTVEGTLAQNGDRASSMSPSNVALLVKKGTTLGGRRGRGRFYIPWIIRDEEVNEVGAVDGTALAAFQAHATVFLAELADPVSALLPMPMVVLHDSSGLGTEPPPSEVTSLTVDPLIGTQRRRLGR